MDKHSERGRAVDENVVVDFKRTIIDYSIAKYLYLFSAHHLRKEHLRTCEHDVSRYVVDMFVCIADYAVMRLAFALEYVEQCATVRFEIISEII